MIKRILCLAVSVSLLAVSCKKDDASSKIDASATEIPPASPEDVVAPEANISAAPAPTDAPQTATPPANGKYPVMAFTKTEHDFGKIKDGDNVTYIFNFENTGESDLIISDAKGSCGCTVPDYPKEPIAPGKKGKIKVSFNSSGKTGQQHKTVTITANTAKGKEQLDIKATVAPKA